VISNPELMSSFSRLQLSFKALHQLGSSQLGLYALYQLGLRTGHYRRTLSTALNRLDMLDRSMQLKFHPRLPGLPDRQVLLEQLKSQVDSLFIEADEIVQGRVRLFGGEPVPLELSLPRKLDDWTKYEGGNNQINGRDIKLFWEPGRFGWASKLGMAYHLSADERYTEAFWHYTEQFLSTNPPYLGPHWSSAQEAAIRLVTLAFVTQIFAQSKVSTPKRIALIAKAIAIHAERIPTTIVYARSQNNNHLITEALGLYTAAAALPEHPLATRWHKLGWKWLNHAFLNQISSDGTYSQHSTNYHRLMLQSALWAFTVHEHTYKQEPFPSSVITRLESATRWLWMLIDPESGRVPNLGHNDGAYFLPLTVCPYEDYRPVIHAAARAFLHMNLDPKGPWDDMTSWLCLPVDQSHREVDLNIWQRTQLNNEAGLLPPYVLFNHKNSSWAALRVVEFHSRPAHADQLHFDLWWQDQNIAQDAGTYLYNAPPPWVNSLTSAFVHNTVTVDGQEFMQRVGRFLYLDWAQGRILESLPSELGGLESLTAKHDGYRKIGVSHTRKVTAATDGHWEVIDLLDGSSSQAHTARLHWLIPDWKYEIREPKVNDNFPAYEIHLKSPQGWIKLKMGIASPTENMISTQDVKFQLVRAGVVLYGSGSTPPITGWTSRTYGDKMPALACIMEQTHKLPIELKSEWILPSEN
jgi:hypothetical protein